jgi:hypothetical protein
MCCSMSKSEMSHTHLYAGEAVRDGKYVHVLGYQNTARSSGPNAMILPLPAKGSLGPDNTIDTRGFSHFLEDISDASRTRMRGGKSASRSLSQSTVQVFDVGSYTVVLAERAGDVQAALAQVPAEKRPAINDAVLASFDRNYPGWPLAVCCWNGNIDAEPLLWWYEPRNTEMLFAPALDSHDGQAPRVGAPVKVDHHLSFGTTLRGATGPKSPVYYRNALPPEVASLLPKAVVGTKITALMPNGDFLMGVGGTGMAERATPPGVPSRSLPVALSGWR